MDFGNDYLDKEIEIEIEEYPMFEGDECISSGTHIMINGENIKMDGSVLNTVLKHLGYNPYISYI